MEHIAIIEKVVKLITNREINEAKMIIKSEYEHNYIQYDTRSMSTFAKLKVYLRDGFIDRYSGKKLLFPNVLRIITMELGDCFPFHANWKMSDCHIAYWEMMPTYDHIVPIARGGKDVPDNVVTTSQIMNSAKSNFLVDEIGFHVYPPGEITKWDGMISWYKKYVDNNPKILSDAYIRQWHTALLKADNESANG